jgi:hypothetical protein
MTDESANPVAPPAIASPSRVCAFSRTRSLSTSAWKVARCTGKMVPSPNGNQDLEATANFRSDTPQGSISHDW